MATNRETGDAVIVFDSRAWGGRDVGDNSQFFKRATIRRTYRSYDGLDLLADVTWEDGTVTCGHIVSMMRDAL